ncbi:MAG: phage tail protein [Oscillospiraceae bacterium]
MTVAQAKSQREGKRKPSNVPPLVGNQYFTVFFGTTCISFLRVSNVQLSAEHEDLQEGGLNGYVHVLTKPGSQSGTLTLEKGVVSGDAASEVLRALSPGTRIHVPVTITLCHLEQGKLQNVRAWGFEDGMVTRREVGNLDGLGSEIAIEKLEITHAGLVALEV